MADYDRLKAIVASFTAAKTKHELFEAAQKRRLLIAPVNTIGDVPSSDHLAARGYWDEVNDREIAPGSFRVTRSLRPALRHAAAPARTPTRPRARHGGRADGRARATRPSAPDPGSIRWPPLAGTRCWI